MDEGRINQAVSKLEELCVAAATPDTRNYITNTLAFRPADLARCDPAKAEEVLLTFCKVMLFDESWACQVASVLALMRVCGKHATKMFLIALTDKQRVVRQAVVTALGCCGAVEAYVAVEARLQDEDVFVRSAAKWALGCFEDDEAVQKVVAEQFHDFLDNVTADDFTRFNHHQ